MITINTTPASQLTVYEYNITSKHVVNLWLNCRYPLSILF